MLNRRDDIAQNRLQVAQVLGNGVAVGHANIRPHVGVGGGDARRVLEAACRKCMRIAVTNTAVLASVLDDMGLEYSVIDDKTTNIYAKPNITQLSLALAKENCEIISVEEHDESLESFYISLVGGGKHE